MAKKHEAIGEVYSERFAKRQTDYPLKPPFPEDVMVELTNVCNHACIFCTSPRMKRAARALDLELFKKFAPEAQKLGCREIGFYSTGEPFMTKNLPEFIRVAADAGIPYIYISTNGALATPERVRPAVEAGLNSIKFSINAASRETYKLIHGKDEFERVLEHVRWIHEFKKEKHPGLRLLGSCVVTRTIENELERHRALFSPFFEDIIYMNATAQAGQAEAEARVVAPTAHPLSFPPLGSQQPCFMLWKRAHLTAEGYLTLCCVDYENNLTYARVDDGRPLLEHWHNEVIVEMRRRQIAQDLTGTLCHNCLYGGDEPYSPLTDLHSQAEDRSNPDKIEHLTRRLSEAREEE